MSRDVPFGCLPFALVTYVMSGQVDIFGFQVEMNNLKTCSFLPLSISETSIVLESLPRHCSNTTNEPFKYMPQETLWEIGTKSGKIRPPISLHRLMKKNNLPPILIVCSQIRQGAMVAKFKVQAVLFVCFKSFVVSDPNDVFALNLVELYHGDHLFRNLTVFPFVIVIDHLLFNHDSLSTK